MNAQTVKLLSFLLSLQLVLLIGVSFVGRQDLSVYSSEETIVDFAVDQVSALLLDSGDAQLSLVKDEQGTWHIKESEEFPADEKKIDGFIQQVTAMRKTWPVAQTESAFKPLKLSEDDFERKIVFKDGASVLETLYLGTSPGFKKVHARLGDESTVYSVELSAFEIPADADAWTDKEFLYIDKKEIQSITLPQVSLARDGDTFSVSSLAETEELRSTEIDGLVSQVASLRFVEMLGTQAPDGLASMEKKITFSVHATNDSVREFTAWGPYEDSFYVLKRGDAGFYFKVAKGGIEKLATVERSALVQEKSKDESDE